MSTSIRWLSPRLLAMFFLVAVVCLVGLSRFASRPAPTLSRVSLKPTDVPKIEGEGALKMQGSEPKWRPNYQDPLADLDKLNASDREFALRNHTLIGNWIQSSNATPERMAAATARIRKAFEDTSPRIRLAAAELTQRPSPFPAITFRPEEAALVCEKLLAEPDVEVHVHDLNATILHLLGINHEKLTYKFQGRDFRLTDVQGNVVKGILS